MNVEHQQHLIRYTLGRDPEVTGTYATRIDEHGMICDKFLCWFEGKWYYPLSDQPYRLPVLAWVGPLARSLSVPIQPRDGHGRFAHPPEKE